MSFKIGDQDGEDFVLNQVCGLAPLESCHRYKLDPT